MSFQQSGTNDFEWYDPSTFKHQSGPYQQLTPLRALGAIHTEGGSLIITQTQEPIHGLNFKSGMLQGWNKVCFWGSMYFEGESRFTVALPVRSDHYT